MKARSVACTVALASVLALLHTAAASGEARSVRLDTVPPTAGVEMKVGNRVFRTNANGLVTVSLPASYGGGTEDLPRGLVRVSPMTRIDAETRVKFLKLYGNTATFSTYKRVTPTFVNVSSGEDVDPAAITKMSLKALTGTVTSMSGRELQDPGYVWLNSARVTPIGGELVNKPVPWSIQSVEIAGSNVVNRSQTRFVPGKGGGLEVPLLFFSTSFSANDALFGFSLGSGVQLHYPNGDVKTLSFGEDGIASPPPLPRGDYEVSVNGPGFSFTRPVSVSRDQDIRLKVFSYLDILFLFGALLAVAIGLPLARRPHARARIRAWLAGLPGIGALPGIRVPIPAPAWNASPQPAARSQANGGVRNGTAGSGPRDPLEALALAVEEQERKRAETITTFERRTGPASRPNGTGDQTEQASTEERSNGKHQAQAKK